MKKILFFLSWFAFCLLGKLQAQNFNGLLAPQDRSLWPKSTVAPQIPIKKEKQQANAQLKPIDAQQSQLTGGWEMIDGYNTSKLGNLIAQPSFDTRSWYNATVPGTVLATLVDQGIYPDPYFGLNNLAIPDSLSRKDWWYRTLVPITKTETDRLHVLLNGINYKAEVWFNGELLGRIEGAFTRGWFDITGKTKEQNVLAIHILPTEHPGFPHEASNKAGAGPNGGTLCYDGPTFISSEGWDWIPGIRGRNIGIWQDVRICKDKGVRIVDPQVWSDLSLPDTTKASVSIRTQLVNDLNKKQIFTLTAKFDQVEIKKTIELKAGEYKTIELLPNEFEALNLNKPRLWWPNGYGNPELYDLNLSLTNEQAEVIDSKKLRFGIRELTYDLTIDYGKHTAARVEFNPLIGLKKGKPMFDNLRGAANPWKSAIPKLRDDADSVLLKEGENKDCSPYLVIKVNGKRIFCKGGNWGMDDGMKRVSRAKLEPYIRLHRDEHFTMLRNWTGESTEEELYELCDEYGILVWNEFWYSTQFYNLDPWDNQLFINNVREVAKRFRNHASIAVWGARNEGYPSLILEDSIRNVLAKEDPSRHYQPSSIGLNLRYSGPWNYQTDQKKYFTEHATGFNTELGTVSVPTAESMKKMMVKEDVWPIGDTWYYHDFNYSQKEYVSAIDSLYGGPTKSVEEFCKKAQMINYDSHRNMFESYNSKLWNNTSGLLLWMSHPAWPSTLWQTYSWDYETHGSYYGSMKACEPVHIQLNLHDNKLVWVNNSLKTYLDARINVKVYDLQSKLLFERKYSANITSDAREDIATLELPTNLPSAYLIRLSMSDSKGQLLSTNDYLRGNGKGANFQDLNSLANVKLNASLNKRNVKGQYAFVVTNTAKTAAYSIKLNLRDKKTGIAVLPAYFSDGYFHLLPGESKKITLNIDEKTEVKDLIISAEGYNVAKQELIKL